MSHIVRINKPQYGIVGYQFRGKNGFTKLFSDSQYGDRSRAQAAAQAYQVQYDQEHPPTTSSPIRSGKTGYSNNSSGRRGVYRSHEYSRGKIKRLRAYWAAHYTIDRHGRRVSRPKKFYVDTWGEQLARQKAIKFRQAWEEAALVGEEAVIAFFASYEESA